MKSICWFSRSYAKIENHLLTDYNRSAHGQFIFVNKTWSNPFFCFPLDFWTFWCVFELFEGNGQKLVRFDFLKFRVWKLLPLQGDRFASVITQGAALGYELLPFQGVSFSPPFPVIPSLVPPLKPILNVKNITYFKYYIANLYFFRFIFVSLQQKLNK